MTSTERGFYVEIQGGALLKNTVFNFVGLSLPLVIGVASIPYIIRRLGTDRFGILSLAWVVVGYFSFFDLGLGRATTKFIAEAIGKRDIETIPKYFWTTAIFQGILGLFGAGILALATPLLTQHVLSIPPALISEARSAFYLLALSLPIVLVTASFRGVLEAGQRFDLVNIVKIPASSINYVLPVVGLFLGFGLPGIMALLVFSRALTLVAWAFICRKAFPMLKTAVVVHRDVIGPLLSFGGWITVSNLISPILVYLDRFLIGTLLSIEAVGYYSAPSEVVSRFGIIPGSLLITLFPTFSTLKGGSDHRRAFSLYERSVRFLTVGIGALAVCLFFLSRDILGVWLGGDFGNRSQAVFQFLVIGFFVNALANVPSGYLQGIGRADITAKFHVVEVLIYMPLAWIMIKRWGIAGAAAASTARMTLDMGLLFWAARRFGDIGSLSFSEKGIGQAIFALSAYAAAGAVAKILNLGIPGLFSLTVLYALGVWLFVLKSTERSWARSRFERLIKGKEGC